MKEEVDFEDEGIDRFVPPPKRKKLALSSSSLELEEEEEDEEEEEYEPSCAERKRLARKRRL